MGKYKGKIEKQEFFLRDQDQDYAKVISVLGDCRFIVKLQTSGQEVIGHVRGNMKSRNKSLWIRKDDIIIVSIRDFQSNKVEIVHKYNSDEIRKLIKLGELDLYKHDDTDDVFLDDTVHDNDELIDFVIDCI
jgi:translation initiation factor 1A